MLKRIFAMLLCLVMVLSIVPVQAFATETADEAEVVIEEPTEATEETTEATEETTEATEETTEATEETTEATEETTEATEETTEATEETTEATVAAAPVETAAVEAVPAANEAESSWRKENGQYYFSSLAGLKEILNLEFSAYEYPYAFYEGDEEIVITENITVPAQMSLVFNAEAGKCVIAEGVTVTNEGRWTIHDMDINGVFVNHADVEVCNVLQINGKLENHKNIFVDLVGKIEGLEGLFLESEFANVRKMYIANSLNQLWTALEAAHDLPYNWIKEIIWNVDADVTVTQSISLPENTEFTISNAHNPSAKVIMQEGCDLVVSENSVLRVGKYLEMNSVLENNGEISQNAGSLVKFGEGGAYQGSGLWYFYVNTSTVDYAEMVSGLDMTNLVIKDYGDFWVLGVYQETDDPDDTITFKDMTELKALLAGVGSDDWLDFHYRGDNAAFTVTEDIVIPENVSVFVRSIEDGDVPCSLVVAQGANVTANGQLFVTDLIVNGSMKIYGTVVVFGDIAVNGNVDVYSQLEFRADSEKKGLDKISLKEEYARLMQSYSCDTVAQLQSTLEDVKTLPDGWYAEISLNVAEDMTLTSNITIPENCSFYINPADYEGPAKKLIIGQNCTFTNNSYNLQIWNAVEVQGTFENHGNVSTSSFDGRAKLIFKENAKCEGNGSWLIDVESTEATHYSDVITGVDFTDFKVEKGESWWSLRNQAGLPQLAAPTNLMWGKIATSVWDEDGEITVELQDLPGAAVWKDNATKNRDYKISFYAEDGTLIKEGSDVYNCAENSEYWMCWMCSEDMLRTELESGKYYFTVQAVPWDESLAAASEVVTSELYTYVKPSEKVAIPTNLHWDKAYQWEAENASFVACWNGTQTRYEIEWYAAKSQTAEKERIAGYGLSYMGEENRDYILRENFLNYEDQYIYFRVRTISDNMEEKTMSDWSAMSEPYFNAAVTVSTLSAPKNLATKNDTGSGRPILTWDVVKNAQYYRIYRATSSKGEYEQVGSSVTTQYTDYYAETTKKYYYKVQAVAGEVISALSSTVSIYSVCVQPEVSISNTASSGKVKLSWDAVSGAKKYYIYRSTSKTSGFKKLDDTKNNYFTDSSAKLGTTYYYKVKAIADNANSAYSSVVSGKRVCAQPTLKITTTASSGKPKLSWGKISGAEDYEVYRAKYNPETQTFGSYTKVKTTGSTSYTDSKAKIGETYSYYVVAVGRKSAKSAPSKTQTRACVCAQVKISSVKNDSTTGNPVIKWYEVSNAHWYRVYRSTKKSSGYKLIGGAFSNGEKYQSYQDTTATAGKKYYYKVQAVDYTLTAGATSDYKYGYADCAKPVVEATLSSKKPKLKWEKVSGASKYEIYRSTKSSSGFKKIATTKSTSYTDKSATTGKTYYYKVMAVASSSSANSAYSNTLKVTKSTGTPKISGTWSMIGIANQDDYGSELDKMKLVFQNNGKVAFYATYYAEIPNNQVDAVLKTGVMEQDEGYFYCRDVTVYKGKYYCYMYYGGYAPGTYTEDGDTVVVTLMTDENSTMVLKKVSPGRYTVESINGVMYDENVTKAILDGGVFTKTK